MNRVTIAEATLDWIIDQTDWDALPEDVARDLKKWRNGDKQPTFRQIERAANQTRLPLGYFLLNQPPQEDLSFIDFRTVDSAALEKPSRDLIDTLYDMSAVQDWMRGYLKREELQPLNFVGSLREITDAKMLASRARDILNLDRDWHQNVQGSQEAYNALRAAISSAGVLVMQSSIVGSNTHRALDPAEFRAFTLIDDYAPLIFINNKDSENGKLFALVHEFIQVCLGQNSLYNRRAKEDRDVQPLETLCHAATEEFLRPLDVRRATRRNIERPGVDFYATLLNRMDLRFLRALANSVATGDTQYTEAFRLTHTNDKTFHKLLNKAGIA